MLSKLKLLNSGLISSWCNNPYTCGVEILAHLLACISRKRSHPHFPAGPQAGAKRAQSGLLGTANLKMHR